MATTVATSYASVASNSDGQRPVRPQCRITCESHRSQNAEPHRITALSHNLGSSNPRTQKALRGPQYRAEYHISFLNLIFVVWIPISLACFLLSGSKFLFWMRITCVLLWYHLAMYNIPLARRSSDSLLISHGFVYLV